MKKNCKPFVLVLRGDKYNRNKQAPINFRLTRNRIPVYIPSGYTIQFDHWDQKSKTVSHKHPNSIQLRNLLNDKLAKLNDRLFQIERDHGNLSSAEIKQLIFNSEDTKKELLFENLVNDKISDMETKGKIGTRDRLKSLNANFREFLKNRNLRLWQIDIKLLRGFESFLIQKNLKESSIQGNIKFIRAILYAGYGGKDKVINNPFLEYKFRKLTTRRDYLTIDEFRLFEAVKVKENSKMAIHQDMFRFAVRGAGMRVSDLLLLRWRDIIQDRVYFTAEKTDQPLSILLSDEALKILKRYRKDNSKASEFVFPILSNYLNYSDKQALDSAISSATSYYNTNLKAIAGRAGITKRVSSHVARHTMATVALNRGMPITLIQQILGHADLKETMIYAKIINKDLDEAIKSVMNY